MLHKATIIVFALFLYNGGLAKGFEVDGAEWEVLGCYKDQRSPRTMDHYTDITDAKRRMKSPIDYETLFRACVKAEGGHGHRFVGIEYNGVECWGSDAAPMTNKVENCKINEAGYGTGTHWSLYVYRIKPVDGGWGKFSAWTKCTKTCGGGSQQRKRSCNKPQPAYDGKMCKGKAEERRSCNATPCPAKETWIKIPGGLKQIDTGSGGAVWGVNSADNIYQLREDGKSWTQIDGKLKHVSHGVGGTWGVNSGDSIFYRDGSQGCSVGTSWTHIPGGLKQIDSGPFGIVYGVNKNDDIFCRTGITGNNLKGTGWHHIAGKLKYVSCCEYGCWGVNSNDQIFFRSGVTQKNPAGTKWVHIAGGLKQIECGPNGAVWGVNSADSIFYRTGVTKKALTGTGWAHVQGGLKDVTVGCNGVYGVNAGGQIWQYAGKELSTPYVTICNGVWSNKMPWPH